MKKGIIFDCDGTLLDSMGMWMSVGRNFLKEQGINDPNIDNECMDMDFNEAAVYMKNKHNLEGEPSYIRLLLNCMIENEYFSKLQLKPGVREYLEYAKSLGIKMIIATNTPRPLVESCFKRLGILDYFVHIVTTTTVKRSKAYPDIYDYCLGVLGLEKKDVVVFEDIKTAIQTLKTFHYDVVGVKDIDNDYIYDMCDWTIDSFEQEKAYTLLKKMI